MAGASENQGPGTRARTRPIAAIGAALSIVAVLLGWVLFAPAQLGGQTAYVIVNGNSMEPSMHRGDLAVVRLVDEYRPGDVVTYRHPDLGHVIHRIVSEEHGQFTLKGDNNDFLDSYQPRRSEIVGRLWFHVPGLGRLFWHLRSPLWGGLVLFVAFAGLLGGTAAGSASAAAHSGAGHPGGGNPMNTVIRNWQDTLALIVAAAVGFGVLGWVGFNRDSEKMVPIERAYTQSGTFRYEAAASDERIYDEGRATTGQPVYLRLSNAVTFTFAYEFSASPPANVRGTYHLVAEVGDASGWRRTISIAEPGEFEGNTFETTGTLRLDRVLEQIATLESRSEVRNDRYSLTIRPQVIIEGDIAGVPFEADFNVAALPFSLDRNRLWLNSGTPETALNPKESNLATTTRSVTNAVQVWFVSIPVPVARVGGMVGSLLATGSALALLFAAGRRGWGDNAKARAVRIAGPAPLDAAQVIDVQSLGDLESVAERIGGVILQEIRPDAHICYVRDGGIVYRFATKPLEFGTERAA